jgi:hypothetical protein
LLLYLTSVIPEYGLGLFLGFDCSYFVWIQAEKSAEKISVAIKKVDKMSLKSLYQP